MDRDVAGTLEAAHLGLACAVQAGDGRLEAELLECLFAASYLEEYLTDPTPWLARMMEIGQELPDQNVQGTAHALFAMHLQDRRPLEARTHAEASEAVYRALGKAVDGVSCAQKSVRACLTLGDLGAAEAGLRRMAAFLGTGEGLTTQRLLFHEKHLVLALARAQYAAALTHLGQATELTAVHQVVWHALLAGWRVRLLAELGAHEEAQGAARALLAALPESANRRPEPRVLVLEVLAELGDVDAAGEVLREVERIPFVGVYWGARRDLARVRLLSPEARMPLLDAVLGHARDYGLRGVAVAAEVRRNAARLDLGRPPLPWESGDHPAGVVSLGEWMAVRARVAGALGDGAEAPAAFRDWAQRTAVLDVPPPYRADFLARTRALLPTGETAMP